MEGFEILGSVSTTISAGQDAFPSDITFTDVPAGLTREIQVQIYAGISSILSMRRNGTNYFINNGVSVIGTITFTLLVLATDTLNVRTDTASVPLDVIIAGG